MVGLHQKLSSDGEETVSEKGGTEVPVERVRERKTGELW